MTDVCKNCGCDDNHACPGGCYWVKPSLCSVCHQKGLRAIVELVVMFLPGAEAETDATLAGKPCKVICEMPGPVLTVQDHIGVVAFSMSADRVFVAHQYETDELTTMFEELVKREAA